MSLLPSKVTLMSVSTSNTYMNLQNFPKLGKNVKLSKKRTLPISGQNLFPQWCSLIRDYTVLKNDSTDKEKQVQNIRPDRGVSTETSSLKLTIEIVGDSVINGITPAGLSSEREHKVRIKPYEGAISVALVDHIHPNLRRKSTLLQYTSVQMTLQTIIIPVFRLT